MKKVEFMGLKLVMGTKEKIALEKELGTSPLNFIFSMVNGMDGENIDLSQMKIPPLPVMVAILFHATQKLNHGINRDKFYEIVDEFLDEENKSVMNLFEVVMEVLQASKYLPQAQEE